MNTRIFSILLAVAVEVILAVVFFSLIPAGLLPTDIRWLDFAVMSVINIIFLLNVLFPLVRLDDGAHKEVAGLGIQWTSTGWYSALAFLFMLGNIIYAGQSGSHAMSFGLQATIQSALLVFFLAGITASRASMEKTREVYAQQEIEKKGKAGIRAAVASLLAKAEDTPSIPAETTDRIRRIAAETRYITPSASSEAIDADKGIVGLCDIIEAALYDYKMNQEMISQQLSKLENDMRRRRNMRN